MTHYAAFAVIVAACWGVGQAALSRMAPPAQRDRWLEWAMATSLGLGIFVVAMQGLGLAGVLRPAPVLALVALGVIAAALQFRGWRRRDFAASPTVTTIDRYALAGLALAAFPTLSAPLAPPVTFDEIMYHLPYARQVAESGRLGVYEWLRYPWFPYNYDLLFAAVLQVYDDVFTHLVHALAGWLSVLVIYRLGLMYVNRLVACMGAAIWLFMGQYESAYIDMAVSLFVLAAFVALWWWRDAASPDKAPTDRGVRWLALSAFLLGLAAGSKYQALTFLPLVGLIVLPRERRPQVWLLAVACFLLPCIYWYVRNAVMTGDPFNPLGAHIFGFTNWNEADYQHQLVDVQENHSNPPNGVLWAVLLAPFGVAAKRSPAVRGGLLFCGWSLLVWGVTSRYPRYLTPSLPLIALMAAVGWHQLGLWIGHAWRARRAARAGPAAAAASARTWTQVIGALALLPLAAACVYHSARNVREISPTPESREAFFLRRVPGYEVLHYLREHPVEGKTYQVMLNDSLYFAPDRVYGDVFGPWRYADYIMLPADELARKLHAQDFGSIVIQTALAPYIHTKPEFDRHFRLILEKDGVRAYRILPIEP
ncbi:hypothetical protein WKW80_08640 [Variovorax humicola]|uniref:Glycosyltransferase RgtA/B/C/D-like domain-containing protein n=1 Tax=Variovorax humicola TaxID=1769758 RepID=A0ABU8VWT6_9BURK